MFIVLPLTLTFVRHGQSQANVMQGREKADPSFVPPAEFFTRPDWQHRLSDTGREQAVTAKEVFIGGLAAHFDTGYVSPFVRARETAALLGGPSFGWLVDDRVTERDWGSTCLLLQTF